MSLVNPDLGNPIVQFLTRVTDPGHITIRWRVGVFGGFDVSPILAVLLIMFLQDTVAETIRDVGLSLN